MSDTSDRIADIIRAQNLTAPQLTEALDAGGLVSDVIVIAKYVDTDGDVCMSCAWTDGQDWIARRGMIETVRDLERVTTPDDD